MSKTKDFVPLLLIGAWVVLGAYAGRQAGRWYGSYEYREAQSREGVIGNLALFATNAEEKLRAKEGVNGAIWGAILALGAYSALSSLSHQWECRKNLSRPETHERTPPPAEI